MEHERLFLEKLADLRERTKAVRAYEVLKAAGILRHFLLDASPLATQAGRRNRIKLAFVVYAAPPPAVLPQFWALLEGIDPGNYLQPQPTESLDLDAFLAHPVMAVNGRLVTVREVIQHAAKFDGAVHTLAAREPKDQELEKWSKKLLPAGMRSTTLALRGISKVVVRALEPLEAAIKGTR
ncbi:MAG TPA: hypothetical protein VMK42_20635 [Anaeromyxobacteraceae bacterium]|nr:hypothetical protein [Anaeromyxobacteraceae bacterium]